LPENCLLVANNSRVVPARLFGRRPGGGVLEMLLLTPPPLLAAGAALSLAGIYSAEAEALMRPAAKLRPGDICIFAPELEAELTARGPMGRCRVRLRWRGDLSELLERGGCLPLPPYIRRPRPVARDADGLCTAQDMGGLCPVQPEGRGLKPRYINLTPTSIDPTPASIDPTPASINPTPMSINAAPASFDLTPSSAELSGAVGERVRVSADALRRMDEERYQTVYARRDKAGSVAAPTAGLHFTAELRDRLRASGREWADLTLYVGYGTFSPVRCRDIREHAMHPEHAEVLAETAAALQAAATAGRPIIAVGTTSARVLEAVFAAQNPATAGLPSSGDAPSRQSPAAYRKECDERLRAKRQAVFRPFAGDVNIFLHPGKRVHVVDGLITNFHLPESTLLLLVSAMAGRERILAAYREALACGFNFFSYGDAMLIL
jgi:S-adenosylmethionine:tRNA ribosyltransferase-isomerase